MHLTKPIIVALSLFAWTAPVSADVEWSGFLDNYEQLNEVDDPWIDYMYMSDGFNEKIVAATTMVIEQPEIFIASDSKYKGIKPDDMKLLSDSFRETLADSMADLYQIALSPGPDTIQVNVAFTNLYLKKKGRRLVGYTPVGLVAGTAKRALLDDFTDKVQLTEGVIEAEFLNAETGDRIGAIVIGLGNKDKKKEFTSWEEVEEAIGISTARLRCRFSNAALPEAERTDCMDVSQLEL